MQQKSIAAIKRHRTARLARLITRAFYLHRRGKSDQMYHQVCEEFMDLGGVYVKFLQGVLLRSQVMKRWHNPERLNIFENLDHEPLDVAAILRQELKPDALKQIVGVQPQPFAAGSFGQVYYGQLADGTPVVIKVLRPLIRDLLRYDLRLLNIFSKRFFGHMTPNMDMSINEAVQDFMNATLRETDYINEAAFARELYEHYKDHETFIIPETYTELCTKNVIVQEYIDGISAAQLIRLQSKGVGPKEYVAEQLNSDLDAQLETLGFELLSGVFDLPRIQGDPHPGNIRLMRDNKIGMIDFGISAASPRNKAALIGLIREWYSLYNDNRSIVGLFEQFMRFFVSDLYRALKKLSSVARRPSEDTNFTAEVGEVAQATFDQSFAGKDIRQMVKNGKILQLLREVVNKDNRFGLVMKLEASETLRAMQTYITLIETLGRRDIVQPLVFSRVIEYVEATYPDLADHNDDNISVGDALDTVSSWLERVAERDPMLFKQLMMRIKLAQKPVEITEMTNV